MGLTVVAAGKSTARDLVWDSQQDHVSVHGRIFQAPDYGRWFRLGESDVDSAIQARTVPGVPRHVAPDLCELTIVANNTGLDVDRADLHAPIARPVELPFFFRPRGEGGILSRIGVVDQFTCLRRSDEMSFAGGVFVVVEAPNPHTGEVLRDIDIPATPDGRYLLIHNPVHLLGVESPISVLTAARLGLPMGARDVVQRFDMIGRARRDFSAGEVFAFGSEWNIDGLDHLIEPAVSLSAGQPLPYWLAGGCRLKSPLAAGETLRFDHVELSTDSTLVRLRKEQDCMKL